MILIASLMTLIILLPMKNSLMQNLTKSLTMRLNDCQTMRRTALCRLSQSNTKLLLRVLFNTVVSLTIIQSAALSAIAQEPPSPRITTSPITAASVASSVSAASSNTLDTPATNIASDQPKKNDVTFDISKTCAVPSYPKIGTRYGLHGDTILKLKIDNTGKIDSFELLRSSGWKALDMLVMQAIVGCQVIPAGNWTPSERLIRYKWVIDPDRVSTGIIETDSCKPSEKLRVANAKEYGLGIVIGVYISPQGKVVDAKVQWGSDNEELDQEALRIAKSCEFTPAENGGKRIGNAESIRFLLKNDR